MSGLQSLAFVLMLVGIEWACIDIKKSIDRLAEMLKKYMGDKE